MRCGNFSGFVLGLALTMAATAASAQSLSDLGPRAPAMAAFVAVADDGSAVLWNPAGLVFGPLFNLSLDFGRSASQSADLPRFPADAGRQQNTLIALALPPVGVSYTRISALAVAPRSPAVVGTGDRQEEQVLLRSVVTSALGVTVLQSLGDYVTVGATLKVVRGGSQRAIGTVGSWDEGFDRAESLERSGSTKADADFGAMAAWRTVRAGLVIRNVSEPTFDGGSGNELTVRRHARVGGLGRSLARPGADDCRGRRRHDARVCGRRRTARCRGRRRTVGWAAPECAGRRSRQHRR